MSDGLCTVLLQTITFEYQDKYDFSKLDVTKIWPEQLFPLQPVGRMVLNKNPDNFFNENEQIAFCPALVVPGAQQYIMQPPRGCALRASPTGSQLNASAQLTAVEGLCLLLCLRLQKPGQVGSCATSLLPLLHVHRLPLA